MVRTYASRIPPSPNVDKVSVSFDKFNNKVYVASVTILVTNKTNYKVDGRLIPILLL